MVCFPSAPVANFLAISGLASDSTEGTTDAGTYQGTPQMQYGLREGWMSVLNRELSLFLQSLDSLVDLSTQVFYLLAQRLNVLSMTAVKPAYEQVALRCSEGLEGSCVWRSRRAYAVTETLKDVLEHLAYAVVKAEVNAALVDSDGHDDGES